MKSWPKRENPLDQYSPTVEALPLVARGRVLLACAALENKRYGSGKGGPLSSYSKKPYEQSLEYADNHAKIKIALSVNSMRLHLIERRLLNMEDKLGQETVDENAVLGSWGAVIYTYSDDRVVNEVDATPETTGVYLENLNRLVKHFEIVTDFPDDLSV